jgi:hypothetical protein
MYILAEEASPIPKVVIAPGVEGFVSASGLPCLVLGTDGFCRACGAVELYMLRLSTLASSKSSSCDVRGVSVEVLVIGSKIDWSETDAESAVLLLLSPGTME